MSKLDGVPAASRSTWPWHTTRIQISEQHDTNWTTLSTHGTECHTATSSGCSRISIFFFLTARARLTTPDHTSMVWSACQKPEDKVAGDTAQRRPESMRISFGSRVRWTFPYWRFPPRQPRAVQLSCSSPGATADCRPSWRHLGCISLQFAS